MTREVGQDRVARWLLYIGLALGLLRFSHLGTWSLWMDEAFTLGDSLHREGTSNPLGYVLLGIFYDLFGGRPDEFLLRLPSSVFGWLCLPAAYWAVRPLVGRRGAAVATLLLAVSAWHVYWSQNARFYTLAQLFGTLGGGIVLRGLFTGRTRVVVVGFVVTLLAAATHPSGGILVVALLVSPWIARLLGVFPGAYEHGRPWRILLYLGCAAVFLGFGWAIEVYVEWKVAKGVGTPLHFLKSTGYLVGPTVLLALLGGAWLTVRHRPHPSILAVLIGGLGLFMALVASIFVRASAQYVFVLLPWIAAAAAIPVVGWEPRPGRGRALRAALPAAVLLALVGPSLLDTWLYFTARNGDRPAWREAYRYVFDHHQPGDLIFGMKAPVGEYYFDPTQDDLRRWSNVAWLDKWRAPMLGDWARYPRRTWLVLSRDPLLEYSAVDRERTRRILREDYRLVVEYDIPWTPRDLDVQVYLRE